MREIKFRGKRIDNGEWVYGYFQICPTNGTIIREIKTGFIYEILPKTVGQYTGLKDKKGKEIYEGDVFTANGKYPKVIEYCEERAGFCVINIDDIKNKDWKDIKQFPGQNWWNEYKRGIEIIGNIHDNPELMGEK